MLANLSVILANSEKFLNDVFILLMIKINEFMRIVQTFWSAEGDPLRNPYGWLEPQYHLMSWALSCLSLRENYNEVVLYTDTSGYNVFIERLKLPYTDVIIQYDGLRCPKHQWAYSKVLTYSLQKKPFLHIDGDVYLPKRLKTKVEQGEIIAQNSEIGTEYYKNMVNNIRLENILFPDFLERELQKESISSYNAGVFGGNDIQFIQEYCQTVFDYINMNNLFNGGENYLSHNILFEQILFYALATEKNKNITTVLERKINDNGYSYSDFCDFYLYENYPLMHIIGGHKRNPRICALLGKTLLNKYPEYYQRIIELFPENHKRFQNLNKGVTYVLPYSEFVDKLRKKWRKLSNDILLDLEKKSCCYFPFFQFTDEQKKAVTIRRNPYLSIYEKQGREKLPQSDMAIIPSLLNNGFHEVPIDDLSYNILTILNKAKSFDSLYNRLQSCFQPNTEENKKIIEQRIREKLEYLFYNKLIFLNII